MPVLAILLACAGAGGASADQEAARNIIIEGVNLGKQQKFEEALSLFQQALESDPASLAAYINVATANFLWGQSEDGDKFVEALKALERASTIAPHERQALNWMRQNGPAVIARLEERANAEGSGAAARYDLGSAYMLLEDYDRAVSEFEKAASLEPGSAAIQGDLGRALLLAGRTEEGRRALEKAVELDPDLPGALLNLGNLRFKEGDLDGALDLYIEARDRAPESALPRAQLGRLYFKKGNLREAKSELNAALALNRHLVHTYLDLADVYLREKKYRAAIEQCEAALREKQKYPEAEILLGELYYLERDLPNARKHYFNYLQTWRQQRTENKELVEKLREHAKSRLQVVRRAMGWRRPKKSSVLLFERAHRYYEAGDYQAALDIINQLLEREESMGKVYALLGTICLRREDPDPELAMNILRSALRDHIVMDEGTRILTYRALAEACLMAGRPEEAGGALRDLLEHQPDHIEAYYELARIHAEKGEEEESLENLKKGAELEKEKGRKTTLHIVLEDPAFDALRDEEEFRRLDEEHRRGGA